MSKKDYKQYSKEIIPDLVAKLKEMVSQCLEVISQKIDKDLSDDKLHNAIKGKKMASESVIETLEMIDRLEQELLGIVPDKNKKVIAKSKSPVKKHVRT